jgi:hypothetical protein
MVPRLWDGHTMRIREMQASVLDTTSGFSLLLLMAEAPRTRLKSQLLMSSRKNMPSTCSRLLLGPSRPCARQTASPQLPLPPGTCVCLRGLRALFWKTTKADDRASLPALAI